MPSNTIRHTTRCQQWASGHSYLRVSRRFESVYTLQGKNLTNTSYAWPHRSHVWQPSTKSLLSWNWAPASGKKSHPRLPHSPPNKPPQSREVRFNKVVTGLLGLSGPIKSDMRSVQVKACHQGQNDTVFNQHKRGYHLGTSK
jgi:hypothetical protein